MQTLVLDQGYSPERIVSWQRAVCLLFGGKVEVVEEYDAEVRSVSLAIRMPAVVRLVSRARRRRHKQALRFSRYNVLTRDGFRCQYCGDRPEQAQLTFDHVVPRSRGGRTSWENIVTACRDCNLEKRNRTPIEAGMKLRVSPVEPKWLPMQLTQPRASHVPREWASWFPIQADA